MKMAVVRNCLWFAVALALAGVRHADGAEKLRIGYGAPSVTMAPLWIAQEGKIFARNGLDVEVLDEKAPWCSGR